MPVLHIIDTLCIGGMERMAVELCNGLVSSGEEVGLCISRGPAPLAAELRDEVRILELERRKRFALPPLLRLAGMMREQGCQLLHAHGRTSFSLAAFMRLLGMHNRPLIYHEHLGVGEEPALPFWLRAFGGRYATAFVGVCAEQEAIARAAGIGPQRFHVVPNARDLTPFAQAPAQDLRARFHLPQDRALALVVAALRPDKGIDLLLDALPQCCSREQLSVIVAGRAADQDYAALCQSRAERLQKAPLLRFVGEQAEIPTLMRNADFLIMPSRRESGPLALIEAMAAELPFASFLVGGVAQAAHAAGLPGFVAPQDCAALAQGIDSLVADWVEGRRRDTKAARSWVDKHHDIEQITQTWLNLYRQLITSDRPAQPPSP